MSIYKSFFRQENASCIAMFFVILWNKANQGGFCMKIARLIAVILSLALLASGLTGCDKIASQISDQLEGSINSETGEFLGGFAHGLIFGDDREVELTYISLDSAATDLTTITQTYNGTDPIVLNFADVCPGDIVSGHFLVSNSSDQEINWSIHLTGDKDLEVFEYIDVSFTCLSGTFSFSGTENFGEAIENGITIAPDDKFIQNTEMGSCGNIFDLLSEDEEAAGGSLEPDSTASVTLWFTVSDGLTNEGIAALEASGLGVELRY